MWQETTFHWQTSWPIPWLLTKSSLSLTNFEIPWPWKKKISLTCGYQLFLQEQKSIKRPIVIQQIPRFMSKYGNLSLNSREMEINHQNVLLVHVVVKCNYYHNHKYNSDAAIAEPKYYLQSPIASRSTRELAGASHNGSNAAFKSWQRMSHDDRTSSTISLCNATLKQ